MQTSMYTSMQNIVKLLSECRAGQGRAFTCRSWGGLRRHGEAIGNQGPAVGLVGAQLGVTHNVDCICGHQLIVLVPVPLPACACHQPVVVRHVSKYTPSKPEACSKYMPVLAWTNSHQQVDDRQTEQAGQSARQTDSK